jgi:CRP/FNR family transcriptional regulator, cyclic AMP receptor protein
MAHVAGRNGPLRTANETGMADRTGTARNSGYPGVPQLGQPRDRNELVQYNAMNSPLITALSTAASAPSCYPARFILFLEGQPSIGIWIITGGAVCLSRAASSGRSYTMHMAYAGTIVGLSAALAEGRMPMTARTEEHSQIAFLDRPSLQRLLQDATCARLIAEKLAHEVQAIYGDTGDILLAGSAKARLARILLSRPIKGVSSHQQLADLANCSRETVTRQIGILQRRGLITYHQGRLQILNLAGLEALK